MKKQIELKESQLNSQQIKINEIVDFTEILINEIGNEVEERIIKVISNCILIIFGIAIVAITFYLNKV